MKSTSEIWSTSTRFISSGIVLSKLRSPTPRERPAACRSTAPAPRRASSSRHRRRARRRAAPREHGSSRSITRATALDETQTRRRESGPGSSVPRSPELVRHRHVVVLTGVHEHATRIRRVAASSANTGVTFTMFGRAPTTETTRKHGLRAMRRACVRDGRPDGQALGSRRVRNIDSRGHVRRHADPGRRRFAGAWHRRLARRRPPARAGPGPLPAARNGDRVGRARAGSTSTTASSTRTIGIIALALILFEGGLAAGWREIRPVLSTSALTGGRRTLLTAVIVGLTAAWLLDLLDARGHAARLDRRGHGRRRHLRGPARLEPRAPARAHPRGQSPASTTRSRSLMVLGFIEWIEQPDYGARWTCSGCSPRSSRSGPPSASRSGALGVERFRRLHCAHDRALPGRVDRARGARLRRRRRAPRLRLPGGLPGRSGARQRQHPRSPHGRATSTTGSPGSARSPSSSCSACWCSRASSATIARRGAADRRAC